MKNVIYIFCFLFLAHGCIEYKRNTSSPKLNAKDSLAITSIYKKIGPWGNEWDLNNIESWNGVILSLNKQGSEYRIVGFKYHGNFNGVFPSEFYDLEELRVLSIGGGCLSGCLSSGIQKLKKLEELYIAYNDMSGEIPEALYKLNNLRKITIGNNKIQGELSDNIKKLSNLDTLIIMDTKLTGELPRSIQNLDNLKLLILNNNLIYGEFPVEILRSNLFIECVNNRISDFKVNKIVSINDIDLPNLQNNLLNDQIISKIRERIDRKSELYKFTNQKLKL